MTLNGAISSDCIQLNSFLGKKEDNDCCQNNNIVCDREGNINKMTLDSNEFPDTLDYSQFPILANLLTLKVTIPNINNNLVPSRFFDQPMINELNIYESSISKIPENINSKCLVMTINLEHNELTEFPYQFSVLPNFQHMYLQDNKISGSIDLQKFKNLNEIGIGKNQIDDIKNIPSGMQTLSVFENPITKIPDEVSSLSDLTELKFSNTKITEIPPNLFKLNKLKKFEIANNPQLKTSIINFGNTNITTCAFDGTNIICYQSNTCSSVKSNEYPECTEEQIKEIKSKQTEVKKQNKAKDNTESKNSKLIYIGGAILLVIIVLLFICKKRRNNRKYKEYDEDDDSENKNYDIVVTEKIKKIRAYEDDSENNNGNNNAQNENTTNTENASITRGFATGIVSNNNDVMTNDQVNVDQSVNQYVGNVSVNTNASVGLYDANASMMNNSYSDNANNYNGYINTDYNNLNNNYNNNYLNPMMNQNNSYSPNLNLVSNNNMQNMMNNSTNYYIPSNGMNNNLSVSMASSYPTTYGITSPPLANSSFTNSIISSSSQTPLAMSSNQNNANASSTSNSINTNDNTNTNSTENDKVESPPSYGTISNNLHSKITPRDVKLPLN